MTRRTVITIICSPFSKHVVILSVVREMQMYEDTLHILLSDKPEIQVETNLKRLDNVDLLSS
jgi:hypothetical protein